MLRGIDTSGENPGRERFVKLPAQERYRVRQGLYRIVYEVRDEILNAQVEKAAHR